MASGPANGSGPFANECWIRSGLVPDGRVRLLQLGLAQDPHIHEAPLTAFSCPHLGNVRHVLERLATDVALLSHPSRENRVVADELEVDSFERAASRKTVRQPLIPCALIVNFH